MAVEFVFIPKQKFLQSQPIVNQILKDPKTANKAEKLSLLKRQPSKSTRTSRSEDISSASGTNQKSATLSQITHVE